MGRANGRNHGRRRPEQTGPVPADLAFSEAPDSAAGRETGVPDAPLPGGLNHIQNPAVVHRKAVVGEPLDPFRGDMSHGVPDTGQGEFRERAEPDVGPRHVRYEEPPEEPAPVPVRIVQAGTKLVRRITSTKTVTAPSIGSQPVLLCGQDVNRVAVHLVNTGSYDAYFGNLRSLSADLANNAVSGGAVLPKNGTGYLKLETQDELYVLCADAANGSSVSVIIETEVRR